MVLFNDSIYYNIHYGNLDATEEEVYAAARQVGPLPGPSVAQIGSKCPIVCVLDRTQH
jgi:hypothetical protein